MNSQLPGVSPNLIERALALHQLGKLSKAERLYAQILKRMPDHFDVQHMLGVLRYQQGRSAQALALIGRALKTNPDAVNALSNYGLVLASLKRFDEALAAYDRALMIKPNFVGALNNRGKTLSELSRFDDALASYNAALAIEPNFAEAHNNRGVVLKELNRFGDALASCDRALAIKPTFAEALLNRGAILRELKRNDEALASYDRALAITPDFADALYGRGNCLKDLQRFEDARTSYKRALSAKRDHLYAFGGLADAALSSCDWIRAEKIGRQMKARIMEGKIVSPLVLLGYCDDALVQLECASNFIRDRVVTLPKPMWRGKTRRHDRIKLAYLSPDFGEHPLAQLIVELLEQHDRSRFEVIGMSYGPNDRSGLRVRIINALDQFHDVRSSSDFEVARLINELQVDIAVDLAGCIKSCRPAILAHRPCPITVNYLGYPGTMGATYIDYIIADRFVIPESQRAFYSEKVVYLPDTYQTNDTKRRIAENVPSRGEAHLPSEGFIFCSFNNSYKITSEIFSIWMQLLRKVDGSILWLLEGNSVAPNILRQEAIKRGVLPDRLRFAPRLKLEDHLARHELADLFLDTLPINAHTTASDALWAGLPVVTCPGASFASRVAGSLLTAIGLPELIASSLKEYEALALRFARDPILLANIKQKLRLHRDTHSLFNTGRFARHIEAAYSKMLERSLSGETPASFSVVGN
jgi:protein O-GlcNAc transferase